MRGMIAVTGMCANIFIPLGQFKTVKTLSGSVGDCHVATLDMPTDKIQNFLRGMLKKVVPWHHQAVGAFLFIQKEICGRGYINKRYVSVANVLGIADVSTVQKWFILCDTVSKHSVKVLIPLVKYIKWYDVNTHFTAAFSEKWQGCDEQTGVHQLEAYKKNIQDTDITVISTHTLNTRTADRKASAKNKENIFSEKRLQWKWNT